MVRVTIDGQSIDVPPDSNLVDAAEHLGIVIPTLCYLKGYEPSTSCQLCTVKDKRSGRLVPACGTKVVEGMEIENDAGEIFKVRRTALELLLSEHVGDCRAPCDFACPAHMDIPLMLQQIGDHELRHAIATVKENIALPAVLGRVCPKPCEKGCRRKVADGPVAICDLKRHVADVDLASENPYLPPCKPATGKRVAVVGGGPSGLAAVYYLRRAGHEVTLIEKEAELGGRLRTEESEDVLPREVLDAEIRQIVRLGVDCRTGTEVSSQTQLDQLCAEFDAVVLAIGKTDSEAVEQLGIRSTKKGVAVDRTTYATSRSGVFAVGNALRGKGMVVRSAADGKEVAKIVDQYLSGKHELGLGYDFSSRMDRVGPEEVDRFLARAAELHGACDDSCGAVGKDEAGLQANRCLGCTCLSHGSCRLEYWSEVYGANPNRFPRVRRPYEVIGRKSSVLFEPGKCIKCELCIKIAEKGGEPLGLTFVGRGFDVQLAVPFDGTLDDALTRVARECVAACPTGALTFAHQRRPPIDEQESVYGLDVSDST